MPRSICFSVLAVVGIALRLASAAEPARDPAAAGKFFETNVRPVLVARCFECHGPDSKPEGNLRLDSLAGMLKGGDLGAAIKPGDARNSLLVSAINHGDFVQMPPKDKLPAKEIADLTAWIGEGAIWPGQSPTQAATPSHASKTFAISAEDRAFWAFQTPLKPPAPAVRNASWPASAIDRFVLAALEEKGLKPAKPAEKRAFIRRATFDLHGLPPTPEEVEAFLADASGEAFARVIDRLLASPRYGERWGRRWLDLARFADSNGMDENMAMANAWRYRDYVIDAFNKDLPYDQFVRQQIAGDLLPAADERARYEQLVATGFLVLGPKMLAEDDPVKMEMDIIDEQVDTIGRAVMGLTLGCARCHDHKFDPIPSSDYYSLAGIFKSTKSMENYRVVAMWSERTLAPDDEAAKEKAIEDEIGGVKAEIKKAEEARKEKESKDPDESKQAIEGLKTQLKSLEVSRPKLPRALAVAERAPQNLRVHLRGSHLTLGAEVPRQFPRILAGDARQPIGGSASGRLELADWLTRADHPLTSRVMVNRIWQGHFGEGLVRSPDNFGKLGERPDNQALLDYLACRFVEGGWSIKAMHRAIMLSSAYRMSTAYDESAARIDPENRLLWRMNRRRLDAEEIRDAILAISGELDLTMGGTLLANENHTYVTSTGASHNVNYENARRTIYLPVLRSAIYEVLQAFDFADPSTANGRRPSTTVAPQALFMMNSAPMLHHTRVLAEKLLREQLDGRAIAGDAARVQMAYHRALSRPASEAETRRAIEFVGRYQSDLAAQNVEASEARIRAWQALVRVILSSNEFIYLE